MAEPHLRPGTDYYVDERGRWVFTAHYHLVRGYCCGNGCRHCPYQGDASIYLPATPTLSVDKTNDEHGPA
jgi:hypothetical protein